MILFDFTWLPLIFVFLLFYFFYNRLRRSIQVSEIGNKAVLITGCDSGFGYELACRLDKLGMTVFAGCLFSEGPGAMQLKSECSYKLQVLQLDVTKDEDIENSLHFINKYQNGKKLWALVNNAGVASLGLVEWISNQSMQQIFEINTFGPHKLTNACLPLLRMSQGRIVFVVSVSGYHTNPGFGAYAMSKHALVALANAYRMELQQWGISVHTVCPALYATDISRPDISRKQVQSHWESTNEEVRSAYGENFAENFHTLTIKKWAPFCRPASKTYEVVDDLVNAIVGQYPKITYFPGFNGKVGYWLQFLLPTRVHDYLMQLTIPKVADNK